MQAQEMGLGALTGRRRQGNEVLVKEYYAQHAFYHGPEMQIRRKNFVLTPEKIKKFYKLPTVSEEDCLYQQLKDREDGFPYEAIAAEVVTNGEDTWIRPHFNKRYLARSDLTPEAKCWLHLVTENIQPTGHVTNIPKHLALLVYLLKSKQPVNIENIMYQAIQKCSKAHHTQLVLPHLISNLMVKANIPQSPDDPKFEPEPPFKYHNIASQKNEDVRRRMRERYEEFGSSTSKELEQLNRKVDKVTTDVTSIKKLLIQMAMHQGIEVELPESSSTDADEAEDEAEALEGSAEGNAETQEGSDPGHMEEDIAQPRDQEAGPSGTQGEASGSEFEPEDDD